jgi:hypothetical protein
MIPLGSHPDWVIWLTVAFVMFILADLAYRIGPWGAAPPPAELPFVSLALSI